MNADNTMMDNNTMKENANMDTKNMQGLSQRKDAEYEVSVVHKELAIPDEELAVESEELPTELKSAEQMGCFDSTFGMANIKGVFGNKVYAALYQDEKGNRYYDFCTRLLDGQLSPMMRVAQSDLLLASMCNFEPESIKKDNGLASVKNDVAKFLKRTTMDYLAKYSGGEVLQIKEVLKVLVNVQTELPLRTASSSKPSRKRFYMDIMETIRQENIFIADEGKTAYYPIGKDQMERIARALGMKLAEMLALLKEYNFLYLVNSSTDYQTKVRINWKGNDVDGKPMKTTNEWMYCILKMDYVAKQLMSGTSTN